MKRKVLSIVLALLMLLSLMPVMAMAESDAAAVDNVSVTAGSAVAVTSASDAMINAVTGAITGFGALINGMNLNDNATYMNILVLLFQFIETMLSTLNSLVIK